MRITPLITYNVQLVAEDMAAKGWSKLDLANNAGVSDMTVIRLLRGDSVRSGNVKKVARALGRSVERYLVRQATQEGRIHG